MFLKTLNYDCYNLFIYASLIQQHCKEWTFYIFVFVVFVALLEIKIYYEINIILLYVRLILFIIKLVIKNK